eukprot:NODE_2791_length_447_cov_373.731156_g2313_i0.p1 GENE.NODE_2791_length_447_cov_373.731156_g2313_i0~~NODE_2791_length_447_cov_373.731156_g2313_i0.p1  ORF type:complete len:117 (+),score=26.10 NODE_2791_length_447_cov_373.731156_g2313_i0:28-351(+)
MGAQHPDDVPRTCPPEAHPDSPPHSRLFVVLKNGMIPRDSVLIEAFLQYGQLDYFELKAGKSIGFAKYTHAADARAALRMDGARVGDCLVKVDIAQAFSSGQKRPRG